MECDEPKTRKVVNDDFLAWADAAGPMDSPSIDAQVNRLDLAAAWGEVALEVRTERRLTQAALSRMLGITRSNYARSERGHHTPSLELILRFAMATNQQAHDLVRRVVDRALRRAGGW